MADDKPPIEYSETSSKILDGQDVAAAEHVLGPNFTIIGKPAPVKQRKKGRGRARKTIELVQAMASIAHNCGPITGRGIGYKLFTAGLIPSMGRNDMQRVYRLLKEEREYGEIDWEAIVDETRGLEIAASWANPEKFAEEMTAAYRRSFWDQQPRRCQVWSEKGTVRGVLKPVLDRYGVGFIAVHGFTSATSAYDIARDNDGRELVVLYVGDYDPSGLCMSEVDLPKRFTQYGGDHITLKRIALTGEHVLDLTPFPAADKSGDPRFKWFTGRYGDQCWELDALDPNVLRDCVEDAIEELIEPEAWARCARVNAAEKESVKDFMQKFNALQKFEQFRREWIGGAG
jgi:hypothetical protein